MATIDAVGGMTALPNADMKVYEKEMYVRLWITRALVGGIVQVKQGGVRLGQTSGSSNRQISSSRGSFPPSWAPRSAVFVLSCSRWSRFPCCFYRGLTRLEMCGRQT